MKKKCKGHLWTKHLANFSMVLDLEPCGVNFYAPDMVVEVCVNCNKIRNSKEHTKSISMTKKYGRLSHRDIKISAY